MAITALVTGGTSALGQQLVDQFGEGSRGIGRANQWNLTAPEVPPAVAEESLGYDIFVNYAYLRGFYQSAFLQAVAELWSKKEKKGLIVNFGSYRTFCNKQECSDYVVHKAALDEASRQWAKLGESGRVRFRTTNLRLGFLDLEKNVGKAFYPGFGIDAKFLSELILRIYNEPRLSFPELVLNPIAARGG